MGINEPTAVKKLIQWTVVGMLVGITIGLVIGIALAGGPGIYTRLDSYENAINAATSLGWISLNEHTQATESVLRMHELKSLSTQLEDTLKIKYEKVVSDDQKDIQSISSMNHNDTATEKPSNKSTYTSTTPKTVYKDGTGDIDIHSATLAQIDEIPYVKVTAAESIYQYLKEHTITSFDQLLEIKGVGEKTIQRLREHFHIK
jgi:DNA uptake protein ComE-like DNA-binding protein